MLAGLCGEGNEGCLGRTRCRGWPPGTPGQRTRAGRWPGRRVEPGQVGDGGRPRRSPSRPPGTGAAGPDVEADRHPSSRRRRAARSRMCVEIVVIRVTRFRSLMSLILPISAATVSRSVAGSFDIRRLSWPGSPPGPARWRSQEHMPEPLLVGGVAVGQCRDRRRAARSLHSGLFFGRPAGQAALADPRVPGHRRIEVTGVPGRPGGVHRGEQVRQDAYGRPAVTGAPSPGRRNAQQQLFEVRRWQRVQVGKAGHVTTFPRARNRHTRHRNPLSSPVRDPHPALALSSAAALTLATRPP